MVFQRVAVLGASAVLRRQCRALGFVRGAVVMARALRTSATSAWPRGTAAVRWPSPDVLPGDEARAVAPIAAGAIKRFYKNVHVKKDNDGRFNVLLDARLLRTPLRKVVALPTEDLAVAIASEWEARTSNDKLDQMHLTMLANTVIDRGDDNRADRTERLLNYMVTDTLVVREDPASALGELQVQQWDPLVRWFETNVLDGAKVSVTHELLEVSQSPEVTDRLRALLNGLDTWQFVGIEEAVQVAKSFMVAAAVARRHIDAERGAYLSRLEYEFQVARWGEVEWGHTLDSYETRTRLAAGALFARLSQAQNAN